MGVLGTTWVAGWLSALSPSVPAPPGLDTLELHWQAPPECPDETAVRSNIADALGDVAGPLRTVAAEGTVDAVMLEDPIGYRLELTVTVADTTVQREVRARDCALLARTTGLVVGLALDAAVDVQAIAIPGAEPGWAVSRAPRVPELTTDNAAVPAVRPTPALPPRVKPPANPPPTTAPRSIDLATRLSAGVDVGVLPEVGAGLDLSVALVGPQWRAEAHGSHWFARREVFEQEPSVGANFAAWSGGGRGCWVPGHHLEIPVCAGVELAQMRASGFGAALNLSTRDLWAAVVVGSGVIWRPRPWLGLFVGADGFIAVRRPGFTGQNRPELHRASAAAIRVLSGVELRIRTQGSPQP